MASPQCKREMTLIEVCRSFPEMAVEAIHKHIKELAATDSQQLKLEISHLANEIEAFLHAGRVDIIESVTLPKMRKLSSN